MNAKLEFLDHVRIKMVQCATITNGDNLRIDNDEQPHPPINLLCGYTIAQYEEFLNNLDFKYHAGYGGQELFGTIWYKDGTWSDRGEYDGSEWWQHYQIPIIPEELLS